MRGRRERMSWLVIVVVHITMTAFSCECPRQYNIEDWDGVENDVTMNVVSIGYIDDAWSFRILGTLHSDGGDTILFHVYRDDCVNPNLELDMRTFASGAIKSTLLSYNTALEGCPGMYNGESFFWDEKIIDGTMEYSHDQEFVTFIFTDFSIVLEGIESRDPPYFSSVLLNGEYRAPINLEFCD